MRPIELNLPAGSTVVGELLADYSHSRRRLMQDILQIHLPTGQSIDVGWYPDFDINGSFHIVVFEGEWDNQIEDPILVKAPSSVAWQIQELVRRLSNPILGQSRGVTEQNSYFWGAAQDALISAEMVPA